MDNASLWNLLRGVDLPATALAPLLFGLAKKPFRERFPWFGWLAPAWTHADPRVRQGAVAMLRGADGAPAFMRLVAACDDPDPGVRQMAVESLRESAARDPARWVHALYHPNEAVRRQALIGSPVANGQRFLPPLLADPANKAVVLRQLRDWRLELSDLPTLLQYTRSGVVPRPLARRIVARSEGLASDACYPFESLPKFETPLGEDAPWLAHVFELFFDKGADGERDRLDGFAPSVTLFRRFLDKLLQCGSWGHGCVPHLVDAVLALGQRKAWNLDAVEAVLALRPSYLENDQPPLEVRRAALGVFYDYVGLVFLEAPYAERLLTGPLCRLSNGERDLWASGAIAVAWDIRIFEPLLTQIAVADLVRAFHYDHAGGLCLFLAAVEGSRRIQVLQELLRELHRKTRDRHALALAAAIEGLPRLAPPLGPEELAKAILLAGEVSRRRGMQKHTERLSGGLERLLQTLPPNETAGVLEHWFGRPGRAGDRFEAQVLAALAGRGSSRFTKAAAALPTPALRRMLQLVSAQSEVLQPLVPALVERLRRHVDPAVQRWVAESSLPKAELAKPEDLDALLERFRPPSLGERRRAWPFLRRDKAGAALEPVPPLFDVLSEFEAGSTARLETVARGASREVILGAARSAIFAGSMLEQRDVLFDALLGTCKPVPIDGLLELLAVEMPTAAIAETAARLLGNSLSRNWKLRHLAEDMLWGIGIGRQLIDKVVAIEMLGGEGLGHTRLGQAKISVNPLPVLKREQNGSDIVRGLILHELGHQKYHAAPADARPHATAHREGIFSLLNLVEDEHLERNLRALDRDFGDKLKRLVAYAFQHCERELPAGKVLQSLGPDALSILTGGCLQVARRPGHVRVDNGELLRHLEHCGNSFARFMRALRMGQGNRENDPKVAQALKLFGRGFRGSSVKKLLKIARELKKIFGDQTRVLDLLGQEVVLAPGEGEIAVHGEGLTDADIAREIKRITAPPEPGQSRGGRGGGDAINVGETTSFEPIVEIRRLPHDRAAHAALVGPVQRPARQLRRCLERLGFANERQTRRTRGTRIDRGQLNNLVLRRDPRVLVARETRRATDLFVGAAIDCSGSMNGERLERAKRFGALLAEACRGVPGVDLRLFGFTHDEIYDAGDARRPAVANLQSSGGNNDAAALWHAAKTARASRRKAKLLVMISDGLPTGCSVEALRGLVQRLTRQRICCAQVAVSPLTEICFPHYVLLEDEDFDRAARRFGATVSRLIAIALERS